MDKSKALRRKEAINLFERWMDTQHPPFRLSSKRIYLVLWRRFLDWLPTQRLHINTVNETHISNFLSSLEDTNRQQRERYQLVILRAYEALQTQIPELINPTASQNLQDMHATSWRDSSSNQSKQFLTPEQCVEIVESLEAEQQRLALEHHSLTAAALWKAHRNSAVVALLLGCGLKALEVLSLRIEAIHPNEDGEYCLDTGCYISFSLQEQLALNRSNPEDSTIHAYIQDHGGKHRVLAMPEWAVKIVLNWKQRLEHTTGHQLLFPSNRVPSEFRSKETMNPATLARIVSGWGNEHGFAGLTAQKLRNSYGGLLLEEGASLSDLDSSMGFVAAAAGSSRLAAEWRHFKSYNC
ncbi:tyrosine-type recombinase/integrase [Paenalcaligenes sp. Me131]|uniref:tyrosine-type recombinase/integrase n=1 Tax=Paenalcaligenes sp. Me131 TaxID=3392636 RepID=UPI003D2B84CE